MHDYKEISKEEELRLLATWRDSPFSHAFVSWNTLDFKRAVAEYFAGMSASTCALLVSALNLTDSQYENARDFGASVLKEHNGLASIESKLNRRQALRIFNDLYLLRRTISVHFENNEERG